jgi:putative transmembrane protein PGPGW
MPARLRREGRYGICKASQEEVPAGRRTVNLNSSLERPPEVEDGEPLAEETREPMPFEIRIEPRPPLPLWARIVIFVVGWLLILVGVAGLVLPGIQGIATILVGAALLSLDNELVYRGLRRLLVRWPHLWRRVERFREKSHDWLHGLFHRRGPHHPGPPLPKGEEGEKTS